MSFSIEIELVGGDKRINTKGSEEILRGFLRHEGREIFKYFEEVSRGFQRHKVVITQKAGVQRKGDSLEIIVGVLDPKDGNRVFSYVNWGTGARVIYPKYAPQLVFRPRYKPATRPGSLSVSPPWEKVGPELRFDSVNNPGIAARRFDKLIQLLMQGEIEHEGKKTMARLARKIWI
jgi:hypothetical protein